MFFGVVLQPGKAYAQTLQYDLYLSQVAVGMTGKKGERSVLELTVEGHTFVVANLRFGEVDQVATDLQLVAGSSVKIANPIGSADLHVLGNYRIEDFDDFGSDLSDEDDSEDDEEDSEGESDFDGSDDDDEDDDEEDDEEEDSESEEEQPQQRKRQQRNDQPEAAAKRARAGAEDAAAAKAKQAPQKPAADASKTPQKPAADAAGKKPAADAKTPQKSDPKTPQKPAADAKTPQKPAADAKTPQKSDAKTPQKPAADAKTPQKPAADAAKTPQKSEPKTPQKPAADAPAEAKTPQKGADSSTPTTPGGSDGTVRLAGGLSYQVLRAAPAAAPVAKKGKTVVVKYRGTLTKGGKEFDASPKFSFKLGAGDVIPGWDLGVAGMKVGEKRKLSIPPNLGYGQDGVKENGQWVIPRNAALTFEVELIQLK